MALTAREKALLEKLNAKAEAPESPAVGRSIHVNIDAGDQKQIDWATKMGFFGDSEIEEEAEEGDEGGGKRELDATPKRRGFFDQ